MGLGRSTQALSHVGPGMPFRAFRPGQPLPLASLPAPALGHPWPSEADGSIPFSSTRISEGLRSRSQALFCCPPLIADRIARRIRGVSLNRRLCLPQREVHVHGIMEDPESPATSPHLIDWTGSTHGAVSAFRRKRGFRRSVFREACGQ